MVEPAITLKTINELSRVVSFLERTNQKDTLKTFAKYNWVSASFDVKDGVLALTFYSDRTCKPDTILYLTVDSQIDRYALWQYFYQPEHRHDWED